MKTIISIYRTGEGWRWQMREATNGRIIGASSEAYQRRAACLANLRRVTGASVRVGTRERKAIYTRCVYLGPREWGHSDPRQ